MAKESETDKKITKLANFGLILARILSSQLY